MTLHLPATAETALPPVERRSRPRRQTARPAPPRFVRVSMGMINRMVAAADVAMILGVTLGVALVDAPQPAPLSVLQIMIAAVVAAVVFVVALRLVGGYRVERYSRVLPQGFDLLFGLVFAALTDRLVVWAFAREALSAGAWLAVWIGAVILGLIAGRLACAAIVRLLWRQGALRRRVAVVGAGPLAGDLVRRIRADAWHRDLEMIGLFDDDTHSAAGSVEDLRRLAQTRRVDLIVLALSWSQSERIFALGDRLQWISADVVAPLEQPGFLSHSSALTQVAGLPMLQLTRHPFRGTQGLVKLAQDYLVAATALLLTAPLTLVAALAIALCRDGPILFRQDRIGFNGRPFSIYKFRTMTIDPLDDGSGVQSRANPRITRIGSWLRRTSIDELPQLLNVLRSEMSIVGPRPHVAAMQIEGDVYAEAVRAYAARHQIRPGITGWAQINGMRGGIDSLAKATRGVELDLWYMRNWSLRLDLTIMLRTLTVQLSGH